MRMLMYVCTCLYACMCIYVYAGIAVVSLYVTPERRITNHPNCFGCVRARAYVCTVDLLDKNSSFLQYFAEDGLLLIRV